MIKNHYKEFTLTECKQCSMELEYPEKLCGICVQNLREEDLLKLQERLCKQYLPKYRKNNA